MEDEGFAVVAIYEAEDRALAAARQLVSSGLGADVAPARVALAEGDEPTDAFQLRVVGDDLVRACELLGVDPPALEDDDASTGPPWKVIIGVWLVAMIVVPLLAFWLTLQIAS